MPRASTIDKLPVEVRERIADLRQQGVTIDDILAALKDLGVDVSRSAVGRHVKGLDELGERLRRSREVSEVLVKRLGDAPESKNARLNIELLHSTITDFFLGSTDQSVTVSPEQVLMLSRSLASLTSAFKNDTDVVVKIRRQVDAERLAQLAELEREAQKPGSDKPALDPETLRRVRSEVYGMPG